MVKTVKNWNSDEIRLVRECLSRMLNSDLFIQSARQSRFLEYIVEKTLAGEGNKIKQYSIGVDVFDRDDSFDPAIDSIVRVEAGRLRAKLREYYSNTGLSDDVKIAMRKGKYIVDFQFENENTKAKSNEKKIDDKPAIAVLAFTNTSGDPSQEYFTDGISEDIITDLSKSPDLSVIARQSSFSYKNTSIGISEIAEQLGVNFILDGSMRKSGDRVRISAQLIDVSNGQQLWAERYDHQLDDIFALQDDVTNKIVSALEVTFGQKDGEQRKYHTPSSIEAYDCVLRGVEYARHSNREDLMQAQALFRKAISLDPEYAEAYARLSRLYVYQWISGFDNVDESVLEEALELAIRAVELCPDSALPHASLGWVYQWLDENDKAMTEWRRAIELDPSQTEALNWLSLNLSWSGNTEEAREKLDCARRLNPLEKYYFPRGMIAFMNVDYENAKNLFEKLIIQDRAFIPGHLFLAASYSILGLKEQGEAVIENIFQINPDFKISRSVRGRIKVPAIAEGFRQHLLELGLD